MTDNIQLHEAMVFFDHEIASTDGRQTVKAGSAHHVIIEIGDDELYRGEVDSIKFAFKVASEKQMAEEILRAKRRLAAWQLILEARRSRNKAPFIISNK